MLGGNQTKRGSMRNTPRNKVKRINAQLLLCLNALEVLEGAGAVDDDELNQKRRWKRAGLERHITHLEGRRRHWGKVAI